MKLPNADRAVVEDRKVTDYLLSDSHPLGRHKAKVFRALGFHADAVDTFIAALLKVGRSGEVESADDTPYGRKYTVLGLLQGPGGSREVRSVWFVDDEQASPRLVTVFPR